MDFFGNPTREDSGARLEQRYSQLSTLAALALGASIALHLVTVAGNDYSGVLSAALALSIFALLVSVPILHRTRSTRTRWVCGLVAVLSLLIEGGDGLYRW